MSQDQSRSVVATIDLSLILEKRLIYDNLALNFVHEQSKHHKVKVKTYYLQSDANKQGNQVHFSPL